MDPLTYQVKVTYPRPYFPPRCRIPRIERVEATFEGVIAQATKEEAPVAASVRNRLDTNYDLRWFKGEFYVRSDDRSRAKWEVPTVDSTEDPFEQYVSARMLENQNHLLVDGVLWEKSAEPYFALNHTCHLHGDSISLEVVTDRQEGGRMPNARCFIATNREAALEAANVIKNAAGGGNIWRKARIEVLIPEAFKLLPFEPEPALPPWKQMLADGIAQLPDDVDALGYHRDVKFVAEAVENTINEWRERNLVYVTRVSLV